MRHTFASIAQEARAYDRSGDYGAAEALGRFVGRCLQRLAQAEGDEQQPAAPLDYKSLDKRTRQFLDQLNAANFPMDMRRDEFLRILQSLGFTVTETKKHFYAFHPELVGVDWGRAVNGIVPLADHARGGNKVHLDAVRDISKALQYIHPHLMKRKNRP